MEVAGANVGITQGSKGGGKLEERSIRQGSEKKVKRGGVETFPQAIQLESLRVYLQAQLVLFL